MLMLCVCLENIEGIVAINDIYRWSPNTGGPGAICRYTLVHILILMSHMWPGDIYNGVFQRD